MLFLRFTDHLWVSNDVSSPSIRYRAADGDHSDPGSVAPESGWRPTTRCSPHFLTLEPRTLGHAVPCCAMAESKVSEEINFIPSHSTVIQE